MPRPQSVSCESISGSTRLSKNELGRARDLGPQIPVAFKRRQSYSISSTKVFYKNTPRRARNEVGHAASGVKVQYIGRTYLQYITIMMAGAFVVVFGAINTSNFERSSSTITYSTDE